MLELLLGEERMEKEFMGLRRMLRLPAIGYLGTDWIKTIREFGRYLEISLSKRRHYGEIGIKSVSIIAREEFRLDIWLNYGEISRRN